jgi:thiamine monophosphate synthase
VHSSIFLASRGHSAANRANAVGRFIAVGGIRLQQSKCGRQVYRRWGHSAATEQMRAAGFIAVGGIRLQIGQMRAAGFIAVFDFISKKQEFNQDHSHTRTNHRFIAFPANKSYNNRVTLSRE